MTKQDKDKTKTKTFQRISPICSLCDVKRPPHAGNKNIELVPVSLLIERIITDSVRMALGPNLVPVLLLAPTSKGIPTKQTSRS